MALIVIKLSDDFENDRVNISMESEPAINLKDPEENTPAHITAFNMMEAAVSNADDFDVEGVK